MTSDAIYDMKQQIAKFERDAKLIQALEFFILKCERSDLNGISIVSRCEKSAEFRFDLSEYPLLQDDVITRLRDYLFRTKAEFAEAKFAQSGGAEND